MEKILISPWHLCRQHLAIVAKKVREEGGREIARRIKVGHTVVARFAKRPEAVNIQTIYKIANEVGMVFRLEIQEKLPNTEKSNKSSEARPKRQPPKKVTSTPRKRPANLPPAPR